MDRITYDPTIDPTTILDRSLRETADLIARWHGADGDRLRYAVTPRFAVSCTAELLCESAALAASTGAYWQTHISEDRGEIDEVIVAGTAVVADGAHTGATPCRALRHGGGLTDPARQASVSRRRPGAIRRSRRAPGRHRASIPRRSERCAATR